MRKRNYWIPWILVMSGMFLVASCTKQESQEMSEKNLDEESAISEALEATNRVLLKTSMGEIEFLLFPDEAPVSVKNFKEYVQSGFYNGCIFHRVIPDFMIQGGGYTANLQRKQTRAPIVNEAPNGLKNLRGTLAYARTDEINSATSQFFINLVDNVDLDHKNTTTDGYGYAVFGKVVRGMDVVDKIAAVKTGASDIPEEAIVIKSAELIRENP